MTPTEHILLETESRPVPDLHEARKSHARIELRSRLRRRVLRLEIIDYYYLSVRSGVRAKPREFSLDLRFVQAPQFSRRIAWRWVAAALALIALTAALVALMLSSRRGLPGGVPLCITLAAASIGATFVCVYRTTETVSLASTYGAVRLLEFTGGLGTFRAARAFMAKLAAHIRLAAGARPHTKAEHLRDEMREHQRLKELGALSVSEYELSKARILAQHAPGRR